MHTLVGRAQSRWNEEDEGEPAEQLQDYLDGADQKVACPSFTTVWDMPADMSGTPSVHLCSANQLLAACLQLQQNQAQLRAAQREAHNQRGKLSGLEGQYAQVSLLRSTSDMQRPHYC